jgi:hypothetical protein
MVMKIDDQEAATPLTPALILFIGICRFFVEGKISG